MEICAGDKILAASRRRAFRGATIPCVNGYSGKKMMVIRVKYHLEHCLSCEQVKTLKKEHHWVKSSCDQIGLGAGHRKKFGQVVDWWSIHTYLYISRLVAECFYPICHQYALSSTRSSMWWTSPQLLSPKACLKTFTRIPMVSSLRRGESL